MACIFSPADKRFVSRREHALQVAQPQESQHGVWRTYCDGSRVIPFEMTAHTMGCDDDRLGLHRGAAQSELNAACGPTLGAWGAPTKKLGVFLGTKGKKT